MNSASSMLLAGVGGGVAAEIVVFAVLHWGLRISGRTAGLIVGFLALLITVPWAVLVWPGADIFAMQLAILLTVAYGLGVLGGRVGRRWHWAPAVLVGFLVFVVATNVVFLGVAEKGITGLFGRLLPQPRDSQVVDSRFPGTVSHDFQEKEAQYNAYLRQVAEQEARGWQVRKGWRRVPVVGEQAAFIVAVVDRDGVPVGGASVEGRFLRISNSREDMAFEMTEVAAGEYRTELVMPLPGLWQLVLQIRRDGELHEVRAETSVATPGRDRE